MSYQEKIQKVPGRKTKDILFFSLSTCFWCDKAKSYLKNLGVEFDYLVVDALSPSEQEGAVNEMSKYNPNMSFPTIVVNNGEKAIIGFNQAELDNLAK